MNPPNPLCTGIIFQKSTDLRFVRCGRCLLWATKQRLRGQIYQIYCRIRRANSGTFNQYTHSITGDNYSTPTNLASRNVKKFRTKGFEYFQEMTEIVENCCAIRALSCASTQGPLDSEEEDDMLNKFWNPDAGGSNVGGSNASEAIPVDLFGDEYMDPAKGKSHKRGPATSQTDSGRSKKSRSSAFDDVCATFTSYVQAKTGHSRARANETEAVSVGGDDYSLDAYQDALLELGDIPPLQYVRALTLFKDKEWRRFFMRTPTHLCLAMILALQ